jgi:hypothetical protein
MFYKYFTGLGRLYRLQGTCKDPKQYSRSQGTTTNLRGDVCGRVKWVVLQKSPDLLYARPRQ